MNEDLTISLDIFYSGKPVRIFNPIRTSSTTFLAFVYPLEENEEEKIYKMELNEEKISLPHYDELENSCKNLSQHIFSALLIRANSIKEAILKDIGELNTAFIITDGKIVDIINFEASSGYEDFFKFSFDKMCKMNADWGVFTELGFNNKMEQHGIVVEIGHPSFGRIYHTPISLNEKNTTLDIHTFSTDLVMSGRGANWK